MKREPWSSKFHRMNISDNLVTNRTVRSTYQWSRIQSVTINTILSRLSAWKSVCSRYPPPDKRMSTPFMASTETPRTSCNSLHFYWLCIVKYGPKMPFAKAPCVPTSSAFYTRDLCSTKPRLLSRSASCLSAGSIKHGVWAVWWL